MNTSDINIFSPSNEHRMLRKNVRKFSKDVLEKGALERDATESFDLALFKKLGELGLLGITADEKYGGSAMDAVAAVIACEEIASVDPGFCLAYLAHSMLCVNNIAVNASEEQKARYLPKLCTGEWIGAMAMSEASAGTDVLAMTTRATKEKDSYVINGRKMWITNGAKDGEKNPADVLFLYGKTDQETRSKGVSSFIIEGGQKGYSVGQKLKGKLGMRSSTTAEMVFEDCRIGHHQLVGVEGESLSHMMRNLEIERLTLAAISLGIAKRCIEIMVKYANERVAFGKKIISFGQIQKHIAESFARYQSCRAYVYSVAVGADLKKSHGRIDSDGAKLICASSAKEIADSAIQVLGGNGYMAEYVVERMWRDAKLIEIGGGTNEAHHKNIARDLSKNIMEIL